MPGVDVEQLVQGQRTATLRALRDYTRLKERAGDGDLAWLLVIDSQVFAAEAEIRWLDRCEARLARAARIGQVPGGTTPPAAVSSPTEQARR